MGSVRHGGRSGGEQPGVGPAGCDGRPLASGAAKDPKAEDHHREAPLKIRATDRRELEARLRRSEARFRDVIERNADAIVVVDRAGVIRFVNRAAESLFGKQREDLLRHPFGFPVISGETTEIELHGQPRRSCIVEMRVVESEWEEQPAYLASLRDVTERKEAEEGARRLIRERLARAAAEQAADRMRFLADSVTLLSSLDYREALAALGELCVRDVADWSVVYAVDAEGSVERLEVAHRCPADAEKARRLREDPVGPGDAHPVHEVLRTRRPLLIEELSADLRETPTPHPRHLGWLEELGITSFLIVPMVARNRAIGALSVATSRPDRRLREEDVALVEDLAHRAALALDNAWLYERAQEAIRAQSDLIAMISHDVRTPLASMLGYAELLTLGIPEPLGEGSLKQVERIQGAGRHLLHLIEQLTEFARIDAPVDETGVEEVDASAFAADVVCLVELLAAERGLELSLEVAGDPDSLRADPGKLRQILVNLLGNAIKFTERGGVVLEVRSSDADVLFAVRDTGKGIEPDHVEKIFLPFWQASRGEGPSGGAGLGLSIVRRLVSRLGGRLSVESTPGRGSTFTVVLPRRAPADGAIASEEDVCQEHSPTARPIPLSSGSARA